MKQAMTVVIAICGVALTGVAEEKEKGWTNLFNGKNLNGWEQKGGKAVYKVEDGAIVGTSVPNTSNSFLCTKKHYSDFVLEFDFLGHPELNSGVQIRSSSLEEYKKGRVHGYQCELEQEDQDRDWSGGIYDEGRRGWLLPKKDDEEAGKKFGEQGKRLWKKGEWNHVRIEAQGDRIKTWVNDELRADLEDDMTATGFIGLQVHGVGEKTTPLSVRWKNIRIKKLGKKSSARTGS